MKRSQLPITLALVLSLAGFISTSTPAYAADSPAGASSSGSASADAPAARKNPCDPKTQIWVGTKITANSPTCIANNGATGGAIVEYLKIILQFLSTIVGAVVVLMIVVAGVQYIVSAGDPKAIADAKKRLTNAITALVLFGLAFAILSFVVPGGIL